MKQANALSRPPEKKQCIVAMLRLVETLGALSKETYHRAQRLAIADKATPFDDRF